MRALLGLAPLLLLLSCTPPAGRFLVATDTNRPPLAFLDDAKHPAGFEIDLLKALAEIEGLPLELKTVPEQGLLRAVPGFGILAGLDRDEYDAVVAATPLSNNLREKYDATGATSNGGPVLVVSLDGPSTLKDWKAEVLAVVTEAASREAAKEAAARDAARPYYNLEAALEDLAEQRVAGVVAPGPSVAAALADNEKFRAFLRVVEGPFGDELTYGILVKKGNEALRDKLNHGLQTLTDSGRLAELRAKWLLR